MSLRALIANALSQGFASLGDVPRPATYQQNTGIVTRDIAAGTSTAVLTSYPLKRVVFARFKEAEVDANISVSTDEKAVFPAGDLPITPSSADTLLDETGRTWEIIRRMNDPASVIVILQVRTTR